MTAPGAPVPAYPSKARLAAELDMAESTVDEMVKRGVLPGPNADGTWTWSEIVARMKSLNNGRDGTVYVVGFADYVKIGFTAAPLQYRLAAIQTGAPEKLAVYAQFPGDRKAERALHLRFVGLRLTGEWFRCTGELDAWIHAGCPA